MKPALVLGSTLCSLLLACAKEPSQDPAAVVLDYTSPHASPSDAARELVKHSKDIVIGGDEHTPARLEWATALDDSGCRRIQRVTVTRTGGSESFEIYKTKVIDPEADCFSWADLDPTQIPYDRVVISMCYRWKGASNSAECAYDDAFMISGDPRVGDDGLEK